MSRNAPTIGEPSSVETAAKLPATPMTTAAIGGASLLDQVDREDTEAAADRDQRRLGTEDDTEAQRRERGEDDAGQLDRRDRRRCCGTRRPVSGRRSREVLDRRGDEEPAEREQRRPATSSARAWKPRSSGSVVNRYCCASATSFRKKYAIVGDRDADDRARSRAAPR